MHKTLFATCLVAVTLAGCQSIPSPGEAGAPGSIACPQERPEICTQQYDPVCALVSPGQYQTYSNACHACADRSVESYRPGACVGD